MRMQPPDSLSHSDARPCANLATFATFALVLLAAGCSGHSIGCVTGTSDKDCAPGTMGHQQMVQERQGEETTATIDDARCRSIAPLNSSGYLA